MKPIPVEIVIQVEQELPEIVNAVERRNGQIALVLDDFEDRPDLLFNTVWFAVSYRRRVVIEPNH